MRKHWDLMLLAFAALGISFGLASESEAFNPALPRWTQRPSATAGYGDAGVVGDAAADAGVDAGAADGGFDGGLYVNAQSLDLGGANERIDVGDVAISGSRSTYSVWVNQANCVSTEGIFAQWGTTGGTQAIIIRLGNGSTTCRPFVAVSGTGSDTHTWTAGNDSFPEGEWAHLCVEFIGGGATNADRLKTYVDGVEITSGGAFSGTIPASIFNTTQSAYIGARNPSNDHMIGGLDELFIFAGGSPPSCPTIFASNTVYDRRNLDPDPTYCWTFNSDTESSITESCSGQTSTPENLDPGDLTSASVPP